MMALEIVHIMIVLVQAERLLQSGVLESGVLVRLNALQRSQPPSDYLLPHCTDTDSIQTAAMHRYANTCIYMYSIPTTNVHGVTSLVRFVPNMILLWTLSLTVQVLYYK